MRRNACWMAAAILLAASFVAPALAQNHFRGGVPGRMTFHRPFVHGPFFRGPVFRGGIFLGVPFAGFIAPYPVYPGYAYAPPFAWYCPNPPGYFPYVAQCAVPWQPVPAG